MREFSSLFDLTPCISILDVNSNFLDISKNLDNIVKPFDGNLTTLNNINLKELRVKAKRSNYEYVVLSNTFLNQENKQLFMKIISMALRDSGYMIIIEEKQKDLTKIYEMLEELDYGAISSIDIFEKHNLIMGKKLHMWGMD